MNAPIKLPPVAPACSNISSSSQNDLLAWTERHHRQLGSIFQSHAYGAPVYVITDPPHVDHVLRRKQPVRGGGVPPARTTSETHSNPGTPLQIAGWSMIGGGAQLEVLSYTALKNESRNGLNVSLCWSDT